MSETVTLTEYAAQCRGICDRAAQSNDGRKCGESRDLDGEIAFSFCGFHFGPVLDADLEPASDEWMPS